MRRSPQDIVYALSHALKEGKIGDEYLVAEIAKRTDMHYMTVNDYLTMIEYIQCNIPKFAKVEQKGNARIIVSQEMELDISEADRLLLRLFDKGAFGKSTAAASESFESQHTDEFIKSGDVIQVDSKIYLSRSGIMKAVDIADQREEKVLRSPIKACSEIRIEDLFRSDMPRIQKVSGKHQYMIESMAEGMRPVYNDSKIRLKATSAC